MLLKVVTDEELLTSQIVKTILLIIISGGILYNIFRIIRSDFGIKIAIHFVVLALLAGAIFLVFREYRIESSLLKHPVYVQGVTTGYCSAFALGQGIEFEYEINGIRYRNCDTFHPVSKDSIVVPGGKYRVRVSPEFPGSGRMNFKIKADL